MGDGGWGMGLAPTAPLGARSGLRRMAGASDRPRPHPLSPIPHSLFWFFVPTWSHKLRLLGSAVLLSFLFCSLLLGHRRQEGLREVRHFDLLVRRQRAHEARRDHHQQFVRALARRAAAEEVPQDGNISQPWHLIHALHYAV